MISELLKISVKNLTHRKLRSWLTMIGIFIGIAAVVSLISLGQGMKDAIAMQFVSLGADTISVRAAGGGFGPPGSFAAVDITTDDLKVVKRTKGVDAAFGRLIEPVRVRVGNKQSTAFIVSIPDKQDEYRLGITLPTQLKVQEGRMIEPGDGCRLVIGERLSTTDTLVRKLRVGDKILIEDKKAEVVGVLEKTGNPQLDSTLFSTESCVREITGEEKKFGLIVARTAEGEDPLVVEDRIRKNLRKSRDVKKGKEDFTVQSSKKVLETLNDILGVVTYVLIGIAGISLLVGGVGIANTMFTTVLERTKEIGILKAIGARNSDVMTLFLIESGLLGMSGGVIGVLIGILLAKLVEKAASQSLGSGLIQANISLPLILGALLFSFTLGTLSGLTPARQAAKLPPVEAIRNE